MSKRACAVAYGSISILVCSTRKLDWRLEHRLNDAARRRGMSCVIGNAFVANQFLLSRGRRNAFDRRGYKFIAAGTSFSTRLQESTHEISSPKRVRRQPFSRRL